MARYKVFLDSANILCKPNAIQSSKVLNYLSKNGHAVVRSLGYADYIIVNTCGVSQQHEEISTALYAKYSAEKKPDAKIISIGCLNAINEQLSERRPEILFISELRQLDEHFHNQVRFDDVKSAYLDEGALPALARSETREFDRTGKLTRQVGAAIAGVFKRLPRGGSRTVEVIEQMHAKNRFYVEIARGCVHSCSYCIIKKARGEVSSRGVDQILSDIEAARVPGAKLALVADDCGSYGVDIGETLLGLMRAIAERFPELDVHLWYLNPMWLERHEEEYLELFAAGRVSGVNLCFQSGSDRIVKLMNRSYSVQNVFRIIDRIRGVSPRTIIETHMIVGFPGEREEDFARSLEVADKVDILISFAYSDREGTRSAAMADKIPEKVKRARFRRLRSRTYQHLLGMVRDDLTQQLLGKRS